MIRKTIVAAIAFAPLLVLWELSNTRADWSIYSPKFDGSYVHPKTDHLGANGFGEHMWTARLFIHKKGNSGASWGMTKEDIVDTNSVWSLTEVSEKWPPFFDHDADPGTANIWPPGEQGTIELWKKDMQGSSTHVTDHHFTVED